MIKYNLNSMHMQNLPESYPQILEGIKAEIRQARLKAVLSANAQMLFLYWQIGKTIMDSSSRPIGAIR
jgi:hypothetical protein